MRAVSHPYVLLSLVALFFVILYVKSQCCWYTPDNKLPSITESKHLDTRMKYEGPKFVECAESFPLKQLPAFTNEETDRILKCVVTSVTERQRSDRHWKTNTDRNAHKYLRPSSTVIELGGNKGDFTKHMIRKYKLQSYMVLEPMRRFYEKLTKDLPKLNGNMRVLNIGLGNSNKFIVLRDINDGTSAFMNSSDPRITDRPLTVVRIVNTIEFFSSIGVGCMDIDLLTMNCEGCEIEVLEMLIETSMIKHFKNVQFQPHANLKHLKDVERRYCEIRERLNITHRIFYSYPFLWESWQRK